MGITYQSSKQYTNTIYKYLQKYLDAHSSMVKNLLVLIKKKSVFKVQNRIMIDKYLQKYLDAHSSMVKDILKPKLKVCSFICLVCLFDEQFLWLFV